jgi:malate dehydrogenase (oxaloacetate-decarboxylating)(NADP+)
MFLAAAKALAAQVTGTDLAAGAVYPPLARIRDCSRAVACAVIRQAVAEGYADQWPLPNLDETVSRAMWFPRYWPIRYQPHRSSEGWSEGPQALNGPFGR